MNYRGVPDKLSRAQQCQVGIILIKKNNFRRLPSTLFPINKLNNFKIKLTLIIEVYKHKIQTVEKCFPKCHFIQDNFIKSEGQSSSVVENE